MCGCMLMHAAMDHAGHGAVGQTVPPPASQAVAGAALRTCAHCGASVQDDFAFCPACGAAQQAAACSSCGRKIEPAWTACPWCGAPLGQRTAEAA